MDIWVAQATGSGSFATVEITGASGDVLTVDTGDTNLGGDLAVAGDSVLTGDLTVEGDFTANGDFTLTSVDAISLISTSNTAPSITLQANGGTSEQILIESYKVLEHLLLILPQQQAVFYSMLLEAHLQQQFHVEAQAGGYQLDGILTSQINVTGSGADLQVNCTGGSFLVTSTESTAGAVTLTASGGSGTVVLAGTGGVSVSATNNTIALTSGTGAMNISADATANAVNVGTGAGVKTVIVGSTNSTSATTINSGTGALSIGTSIAKAITIGNNTTSTSVSIQAGTAGAGAINIGTTANAVPVVIGNATGASSVSVLAGTGGITLNANSTGKISLVSQAVTAAAFSATNNALVGTVTLTGQTLANAATQAITISNSNIPLQMQYY